jgi:nucleotide-binding universal stress UspA family protein
MTDRINDVCEIGKKGGIMYNSIMVPLDGTSFAEEALPTAIHLTRTCGARLVLARVVDRTAPSLLLTSALAGQSWADTPTDRAADYLFDVSERILRSTGVKAQTLVLRGGIASSLRKEADEMECDLIVMSTHAHGPVGRALQSSTADRLARSATCPVLLVRANGVSSDWNIHRRFLHILVPLDGTAASERSLTAAVQIANLDGARLTLLHVAQPQLVAANIAATPFASVYMGGSAAPEDIERMSSDYLDSVATSLRAQMGYPSIEARLLHGTPGEEIIEFAEKNGVDLIAMSTRGLGGVRRVLLGSTTTRVLQHASAAVMLLPPEAKV